MLLAYNIWYYAVKRTAIIMMFKSSWDDLLPFIVNMDFKSSDNMFITFEQSILICLSSWPVQMVLWNFSSVRLCIKIGTREMFATGASLESFYARVLL